MRTNTVSLVSLFTHRRGIAMFMASLILLSISVLALSTMNRLSEASQATGKAQESKKLAILADSATRVALAEVTAQFIGASNAPNIIYVNASNSSSGQTLYRVVTDTDASTPLFGYRARANLLMVGDGSTTPPGTEIPLSNRNTCYDIVVDTVEVIPLTAANSTVHSTLGGPSSGYYWGQMKSIGVTSCFRKR